MKQEFNLSAGTSEVLRLKVMLQQIANEALDMYEQINGDIEASNAYYNTIWSHIVLVQQDLNLLLNASIEDNLSSAKNVKASIIAV